MQRTVWQWSVSYKSGNLASLIETTIYKELVFKNVWYDHIKIIIIQKKRTQRHDCKSSDYKNPVN